MNMVISREESRTDHEGFVRDFSMMKFGDSAFRGSQLNTMEMFHCLSHLQIAILRSHGANNSEALVCLVQMVHSPHEAEVVLLLSAPLLCRTCQKNDLHVHGEALQQFSPMRTRPALQLCPFCRQACNGEVAGLLSVSSPETDLDHEPFGS